MSFFKVDNPIIVDASIVNEVYVYQRIILFHGYHP